jgi:hypothetical protein
MKAIINGSRYDTEKAILIGEASGGSEFVNDYRYWSAGLYRTPRSGRYFLAGSGGPMSRFAVSRGINEWSGGEGVHPMEEADAFEWAQEYLDAETVEAHFGHLIEDA